MPTPLIVRLERSTLRVGSPSRASAANLLGTTLTRQFPSAPFIRMISFGDICSLPGQNGQVAEYFGSGFTSVRLVFSSSGRLARSVAITTHSFVKRFCRISGIGFSPGGRGYQTPRARTRNRQSGRMLKFRHAFIHTMEERKIPVGILGATGVVGHRFVHLSQR